MDPSSAMYSSTLHIMANSNLYVTYVKFAMHYARNANHREPTAGFRQMRSAVLLAGIGIARNPGCHGLYPPGLYPGLYKRALNSRVGASASARYRPPPWRGGSEP